MATAAVTLAVSCMIRAALLFPSAVEEVNTKTGAVENSERRAVNTCRTGD